MEATSRAPCITPCCRKQLVTKTSFLSMTGIINETCLLKQCKSTLTEIKFWAQDVNSRDRDVGASRDRDVETETTSLLYHNFIHCWDDSVAQRLASLLAQ